MNKNRKFRRFRLSMLFAAIVFLIMLSTIILLSLMTMLLVRFGVLNGEIFTTNRFPLFFFCTISVVLGTVLAFAVSGKPLKPIRIIMDAADKIAAGDYSVRIDLKRPEEFRQLGEKFNHMAEEIGSVEMLRSDFVNNFSHEFKTPIVSIRGFAKALKWDDLTPEEREEYLDIIISESDRLSELSMNVLYLSKIEKQSILTDKQKINISEQIRLVIALLDQRFTDKNLRIVFDSQEYFITGNEEMLRQVWINLLDNAIKFSPINGTITVTISRDELHTCIAVTNEGAAIKPEEQAHVFDKFYQADQSHSTRGNGLGLSIVKKIVDLHGGMVTIASDVYTTFAISFNNNWKQ